MAIPHPPVVAPKTKTQLVKKTFFVVFFKPKNVIAFHFASLHVNDTLQEGSCLFVPYCQLTFLHRLQLLVALFAFLVFVDALFTVRYAHQMLLE